MNREAFWRNSKWFLGYLLTAIVLLVTVIFFWFLYESTILLMQKAWDQAALEVAEKRNFAEVIRNLTWSFAAFLGVIGGIIGLWLSWKRTQSLDAQAEAAKRQADTAEQGNITERFSKAVEMLGKNQEDIRVGAIFALERIAKNSPEDHWTIMETLSSFVKNRQARSQGAKSKLKKTDVEPSDAKNPKSETQQDDKPTSVTPDVQKALIVISQRKVEQDGEGNVLHLRHISMRNAELPKANFANASLIGSDFSGADLFRANLTEADLSGANLSDADLNSAALSKANLSRANLRNVSLSGAELAGANLDGADLSGANLRWANLYGAELFGAKLRSAKLREAKVTPEQLQTAIRDDD